MGAGFSLGWRGSGSGMVSPRRQRPAVSPPTRPASLRPRWALEPASSLSDQQIADVTAWYAAQVPTATLDADAAEAPELCAGCHGADGIAVVEGAPNLAGGGL